MKNTAHNPAIRVESPGLLDNNGAIRFAHVILLAGSLFLLVACL